MADASIDSALDDSDDDMATASDTNPADDLGDALSAAPSDDPAAASDDDLLDRPSASPDDIGDTGGIALEDELVDDEDLVGEKIAETPDETGRLDA